MKRWLSYFSAYVVLACIVAAGIGSLNIPRFLALSGRAQHTNGVVVRQTCNEHATLVYRFRVSGREIEHQGSALGDCESIPPGSQVGVWFVEDQPDMSTLRAPQDELNNELISVALAAAIFPAFLLAAFVRLFRGIMR